MDVSGSAEMPRLSSSQLKVILKLALKIADVGHVTSPIEQCIQWVEKLEEENFHQVR